MLMFFQVLNRFTELKYFSQFEQFTFSQLTSVKLLSQIPVREFANGSFNELKTSIKFIGRDQHFFDNTEWVLMT